MVWKDITPHDRDLASFTDPKKSELSTEKGKESVSTGTIEKKSRNVASPQVPLCDSSRGIGIVLVVLYHMGYQAFMNAWMFITLFFSLSGFLITKNTIEAFERNGHVDIMKFWAKRVSRLFPVALLMIIIIVLSQTMPFRHNDGATYQREATDLWYATIFLTNYNLVYLQPDDYFDEFSQPSVTRHLWTLSIEEQYYILWPLVVWVLTKVIFYFFKKDVGEDVEEKDLKSSAIESGNQGTDVMEEHVDYKPYLLQSTSIKSLIRAIFIMDLVVMIVSYFSSWVTIDAMGLTAAYYSTWCRMGDIASGGFTYTFSRLQPYIARRFYNDPTLPPLTTKERIVLEIMSCTIFLTIVVSMLQIPTEDMIVMYFSYLRVFLSLIAFSYIGHTIQLNTGEMPRWCVVTKLLKSKFLTLFGNISYGAYIIHWPILVYFGDPRGMHRHQVEAGMEDDKTARLLNEENVFFFLLTFAIAYISFVYYEVPCMKKSRATTPWKTVMTGLSAMAVTLMIIWLVTKDLPPSINFENDLDNPDFIMEEIDPRYVPIVMVSRDIEMTNLFWQKVLTTNTIVQNKHYNNVKAISEHHDDFENNDGMIIFECKNIATDISPPMGPCDFEKINNTELYWFWLDSDRICGNATIPKDFDFSERCPEKFKIDEIMLTQPPSEDPFDNSNETEVLIQMYELLENINDLLPGVMNQNFVSQMKEDYDLLLNPWKKLLTDTGPIRITMIGESISLRIGMYWKEYVTIDLPSLGYEPDDSEIPSLKTISNMAVSGSSAIVFWLCKSQDPSYQFDNLLCDQFYDPQLVHGVMDSFQTTKPNIVAIHDQHWFREDLESEGVENTLDQPIVLIPPAEHDRYFIMDRFVRILSFNIMASDALYNGADSIVYMTQSPDVGEDKENRMASENYFSEIDAIHDALTILSCSDSHDSFSRRINVTVVDWAKLICPHIGDYTVCEKYNVHGFDDILPDGWHPYGESGEWLTRIALSIVLGSYGVERGYYTTFNESLQNPMSEQLLTLAPPDGNPPLEDLVTNFTICPYDDDYKELEGQVNK